MSWWYLSYVGRCRGGKCRGGICRTVAFVAGVFVVGVLSTGVFVRLPLFYVPTLCPST